VAVVTGASRGIGAAVADALLGEGATVVRLARSLADHTEGRRLDLPCDVTDQGQVARAARRVHAEVGTPDLLVNNAGSFLLAPLEATEPADFDLQMNIGVRGPFLVLRAFLPAMRDARRGLVVTIGSIADHVGLPGNTAYGAAKFALRGLHEALVAELRGSGVRFTLVSPGPTDTAVWDPVDPDRRPGFTPRARMLRPADVAEAVTFIATRPPHVHVDWLRLGPA
jgi:NAD(P)-dependent dehydrogenase (short-subunit alcohol dehydrogenase family)